MREPLVILSIHPEYAEKIFSGIKQIELRRSRPKFSPGTIVLVYSTAPVQKIEGFFIVSQIIENTPESLWNDYSDLCGVTEDEYQTYFNEALQSYGLFVSKAIRFPRPISLHDFQDICPGFFPPQSYRYLRPDQPAYDLLRKKCLRST